jgi:homoserine kinase
MTADAERPRLAVGTTATVEAPATSANLGPGFDAFGLALDWRDTLTVTVTERGVAVALTGECATTLPLDENHLVIRCVQAALASLEVAAPGLHLAAHNTIPHGRGLGSSSAAIVGGLAAGWALARPEQALDLDWALRLATDIEGHPDNVAAAVFGGFVVAYTDRHHQVRVVRPRVHRDVGGLVLVPSTPVATARARGLLPAFVPHADAAADAGRAALLLHALTADPDVLLEATTDWLHQSYRASAMPASADLCTALRARGYAAVISGAGPTVLVLGRAAELAALGAVPVAGFDIRAVSIGQGVAVTADGSG